MFAWSTTSLPNPTNDLSGKNESSVIRTKMESGRFVQRRRFTSGLRSFNLSWQLTDAEFALFQGVHKYKLSSGADWFEMSLPFGDGFKTYTVRFTDSGYTFQHNEVMHWTVRAALETEDVSPLDESEVDAILPP